MPKITFCNQPASLTQTKRHLFLPEDYRREVDAHWAQINAEGKFFNGPVLHTSSPGQIQCAGGGVELTVDGTLNPGECCRRELAEELGAGFLEYQPLFKPLCIKTGGRLETVGLIYLVLFDGDASQAQSLFRSHREGQLAHGEEPEFDTLLAIPLDPRSVDQFLAQQGDAIVDYLATLLSEHRDALLVDVP